VTLENDAISGNTVIFDGGGVYNAGTATLSNDTFSDDSASDFGGGVANEGGVISMTNDTFDGDSAAAGGGFLNVGTATATNDTFAQDVGNPGDGILNDGVLSIANSVFSDASCSSFGPITDNGYNVESDASCGSSPTDITNSSSINLAPSLAANGSTGPSTLAIDPTSSAYEIVPAGNCLFVTDERGDPRPGVPGASCDAGAYEYQAPAAAVTVRSGQFITFSPIANVFLGVAPFALSPVASSGLPVILTSQDPSVCTTSGLTVSVLSVGTCGLVASQGGNGQFLPTAIVQSFDVAAVISVHVPGRAHIRRAIAFTSGRVALDVSPPSNGGSRITSYEYSVNGGPWVSVGFGGRVVVTGLKASRVVRLRVRARNAVGVSPSSNTVRVIAR
ncbi:MAG TPA: choice-of-anchor Q domain-containing protein, partial [Acidimicrobiales bacterium]|nr:choice-of-anchor Q domain-containing protein [Acidimicrobiales bacterium]